MTPPAVICRASGSKEDRFSCTKFASCDGLSVRLRSVLVRRPEVGELAQEVVVWPHLVLRHPPVCQDGNQVINRTWLRTLSASTFTSCRDRGGLQLVFFSGHSRHIGLFSHHS